MPAKFPHGIRPLADYLAARGIGLGVYTDHGNGSCGHGPGSYGHYDLGAHHACWPDTPTRRPCLMHAAATCDGARLLLRHRSVMLP
jgi:hypothetical protein